MGRPGQYGQHRFTRPLNSDYPNKYTTHYMKLDYIHNINEYGEHVVRLYDFPKQEAIRVKQAIEETVIANQQPLDLATLEFVEPRNCYLTLRIADSNEGILTLDKVEFHCFLTLEGYKQMVKLMEPFCLKDSKAYQFLYEIDTPIDFLFAPAGTW
jgi:hypothetical protein